MTIPTPVNADWPTLRIRLMNAAASPLDFMAELLKTCQEDAAYLQHVLQSSSESPVLRTCAAKLSATIGKTWPTADIEGALETWLDTAAALPAPLLAPIAGIRALAEAMDRNYADHLSFEFVRSWGDTELTDGCLIVKPDNKMERFSEEIHLSTRPIYHSGSSIHAARVGRCHLFDAGRYLGIRVRVNTTHATALAGALSGLPKAATVHPIDDRCDNNAEPLGDGIFGVRPTNATVAWEQTTRLLDLAKTEGASIAVVPELNIHPSIEPALTHTAPALVLCGSRHVLDGERHVNEATLHLHGEVIARHHKTIPFSKDGSSNPKTRENIDCGDTITAVYSGQWAAVPLICADVNRDDVIEVLRDLGLNLLLVASMSQRIGYFRSRLEGFALDSQGLAVWANDPLGDPKVQTSGFFLPREGAHSEMLTEQQPSLAVFDWVSSVNQPAI